MGARGIYFRDFVCRQVATGVSVAVDRKGVKGDYRDSNDENRSEKKHRPP
jgi:hypothetical protein